MSKELDVKAVYEFVLEDFENFIKEMATSLKAIEALKEFAEQILSDNDSIEVQGIKLTELIQLADNASEMVSQIETVKDVIKGIAYIEHDIVLFDPEQMKEIEEMIAAFGGLKNWS